MSDQATDASLIARTRRGDMAAYEELYRRHVDDAAKVARIVTDNSEDAPDLVNEAFTRILTRLNDGGGPEDELGPYLRTIVRRLAVDRHRGRARTPTADPDTLDVLPTADDPIDRADTTHLVRTAFETLPDRWQQVLWHTEIEGRSPASLASMLDVAPNAVAALAYRAREGLRQAYLSVNLPREVRAECRSYTQKLPAYTRGTLSVAATEDMSVHLSTCSDCGDRRDELLLLTSDLRGLLVPALLLPAAAGAGAAAAGAGAAAGGGVLAWLSPTTWAKNPGTAVASAAGVAVVAVATALALTSGGDEPAADPSSDAPSGEVAAPLPPEDQPADPPADEPESPADDPEPPADSPVEQPAGPPADQPDPPVDQPEPPADDPAPPDEEPEPPAEDPDPEAPSIEVDLNTDVEVDDGGSVRLSVQVAGYPAPNLQWQRQAPPESAEARVTAAVTAMARIFDGPDSSAVTTADAATGWVDVDGETGTEFVIPETTWRHDGESYRVVATNDSGSLTSSPATLDVRYEPIVLADPGLDGPVDAGDPVTLTASVRGNPVPAADDVTWERRGPTGSWAPLEADTSTTGTGRRTVEMTASFDADVPDHEARFRAVVTNGSGDPVATAPAEAIVHWAPTITDPPADSTASLADTATLEAAVSGNPLDADDIQWEQRDPGTGRWTPADGDDTLTGTLDHEAGATSTLTVDASSKSLNRTRYRVVATPDGGTPAISAPADLTVTWPTEILSQPDTIERDEGATASFSARFSGSPFESDDARWQYREPDGKWTTVDAPSSLDGDPATEEGATSTLTVDATRANDARNYRFVSGDIESDAAELTVYWKPEVTDDPPESLDVRWQSDATISATIDADRDSEPVWQRRPDGSRGWSDVRGHPKPVRDGHRWEATLPVADTFQNADYRLVATSSAGDTVTTDEAQVTVAASGTLRITGEGDTYCVGTGEDTERAELVDCADATEFTRRPGSDRLAEERRHSPDSEADVETRCLSLPRVWTTRGVPVSMVDCDSTWSSVHRSWTSDTFPSTNSDEPGTAQPELVYLKHFRWAGDGVCLDVEGGEEAIEAGSSLIAHECHGGKNQLFTFAH